MVDAVSSFFLFLALTNALFRSIFSRISVENLYRNIFDGKEYSIQFITQEHILACARDCRSKRERGS